MRNKRGLRITTFDCAGLVLPLHNSKPQPPIDHERLCVFVICDPSPAAKSRTILANLLEGTSDSHLRLTEDAAELATAHRVLLVLTPGVLCGDGVPLQQLEQVLSLDANRGLDRLAAVYDEVWKFNCDEQRAAL